jgi:flagellar basal-body rod protein FlgG
VAGTSSSQGIAAPTGMQVGTGVRTASTYRSHATGDLAQTGNEFDMAIEGRGFFQIALPGGDIAYTRAGNFTVDGQGQLTTPDGYLLDPSISIPQGATAIEIADDGTVSGLLPGETASSEFGQIQTVDFVNPAGLESIGRNFYRATTASGDPQVGTPSVQGLGNIRQGFLELSNVKVVEEMISLISSQRAYEINSKVIQASDEMLQTTAQTA